MLMAAQLPVEILLRERGQRVDFVQGPFPCFVGEGEEGEPCDVDGGAVVVQVVGAGPTKVRLILCQTHATELGVLLGTANIKAFQHRNPLKHDDVRVASRKPYEPPAVTEVYRPLSQWVDLYDKGWRLHRVVARVTVSDNTRLAVACGITYGGGNDLSEYWVERVESLGALTTTAVCEDCK